MRKIFIFFLFITSIVYSQKPIDLVHSSTSYVDDFGKVFTEEQKTTLDAMIRSFKDTVQISLVTIETFGDYDPADFAVELGRHWGVGSKSNNGLLIVLSPKDRRIQVATGYGIEGDLPDATVVQLQRVYAIPHFKEGDYYSGVHDLLKAYINELSPSAKQLRKAQEEAAVLAREKQWQETKNNILNFLMGLLIFVVISSPFVYKIYKKRKQRKKEETEKQRKAWEEYKRQQEEIWAERQRKLNDKILSEGISFLSDENKKPSNFLNYTIDYQVEARAQYETYYYSLMGAVTALNYSYISNLLNNLKTLITYITESPEQRASRLASEETERKRKIKQEEERIRRSSYDSYSSSSSSYGSSSSYDSDSSSSFGGGSFGGGGGGSSWS